MIVLGAIMKNNLIYLVGIPLIWLLVAIATYTPITDRVYLLAIAPSAWLILFTKFYSLSIYQIISGGLPAMVVIGFILLLMKVKLSHLAIGTAVSTIILWLLLLITVSKGTAIKVPGAPAVWLLCCFNLSLCLLPFFALPLKFSLFMKRKGKHNG